ncbi:autotransporter outer membrane beta-barrel domain-containing protein [Luteibacter rhizovicinus]|nr:autotransporter outer membrane beta-barrel domain-containing protein [Luteibacter rhizovicinus]
MVLAYAAIQPLHAQTAPVVVDNSTETVTSAVPPESYDVINGGVLNVLTGGKTHQVTIDASTLTMAGATVFGNDLAHAGFPVIRLLDSTGSIADSTISAPLSGGIDARDSVLSLAHTTMDAQGVALYLSASGAHAVGSTSQVTVTDSVLAGNGGAFVVAGADLSLARTTLLGRDDGSDLSGAGLTLLGGTTRATDGSTITGDRNGVRIFADTFEGIDYSATLLIDRSSVTGSAGSAILVNKIFEDPDIPVITANITVANGSSLSGGNGRLLEVADGSTAYLTVDNSVLTGDVFADAASVADLTMRNQAQLTGHLDGVRNVALSGGSTLTLAGSTRVLGSFDLNDTSLVHFGPGIDRTLRVAHDFSGNGGTLGLETELNAGGALSDQHTDRLLIEGNVTSRGTTLIDVRPTGVGALTDLNQTGQIEANEGISLVQVGGASRADAFAIKGTYVAVGPWRYELAAFGPGQTHPAQNLLEGGTLNWDYRLANKYVCQTNCVGPVEPPGPDPVPCEVTGTCEPPVRPDPPPIFRPEVVPQVPSYIVAPTALLSYGNLMVDTLHRRLGDIRGTPTPDGTSGEVFARYIGSQQSYTTNVGFTSFGYDFDQQINALQLGGSVISTVSDAGTFRAGWALDHGTTRITPHAVDGDSHARYTSNGIGAWMTWQADNGFFVDAVLAGSRYRGDVGTDARGRDVATVRAKGWIASVETGYAIGLGWNWTIEPQVQLKRQTLSFDDIHDVDGLLANLGTASQTVGRVGALLSYGGTSRFVPYARFDLNKTWGGQTDVNVSSTEWKAQQGFFSGKVGTGYRVGAGITSQLTRRLSVYGEGNYEHQFASFGVRAWSLTAGLRFNF